MQPSHRMRAFEPERRFVGRDAELTTLLDHFFEPSGERYRVVNIFALGGQGKTTLSHQLRERLRADPRFARRQHVCAHVDLSTLELRQIDKALLSVRLQIAQETKQRFPAFDAALARQLHLVNPGASIRERYPEIFRNPDVPRAYCRAMGEAGSASGSRARNEANPQGAGSQAWRAKLATTRAAQEYRCGDP